jgi:hypothetical protein
MKIQMGVQCQKVTDREYFGQSIALKIEKPEEIPFRTLFPIEKERFLAEKASGPLIYCSVRYYF